MARLPLTEEQVSPTKVVLKLGKIGLTDEQFWQLCCDNRDFDMELTAQKELIIMPPVGLNSAWRENILTTRLTVWAENDGTGIVCSPSALFRLANSAFRGPDASWTRKEKLHVFKKDELEKFGQFCPDFVAEIRDVPPGSDWLRALVLPDPGAGFTAGGMPRNNTVVPLEISNADVEIVALVLTPGFQIKGLITLDGGSLSTLPNVERTRVFLTPLEPTTPFGSPPDPISRSYSGSAA